MIAGIHKFSKKDCKLSVVLIPVALELLAGVDPNVASWNPDAISISFSVENAIVFLQNLNINEGRRF